MKNTQNLKLNKPDGSDLVKISDLNTNWDMLDSVIGSTEALETVNKNSLISALNEVNAKVEAGAAGGDDNYVLPKASPTVLGGVKIGQGVSVDTNGVLSTNDNVAWVSDMLSKIGLLESLTTTAKDSLVNAINEINAKSGGEVGNVTWESLTGKPSQFPSSPSLAGLGNVQNFGIATEHEAITGASNATYMTPLRVENKIRSELAWKEIKANENLDHYKTAGNYYCPLNVVADTITNAPFGAVAFSLGVFKNAGCTQIATTFKNGSEAIKIRNEYQGVYGAWVDVITGHNISKTWGQNGLSLPTENHVYAFATSNFLRDMKRNLSVSDLNNPNYPFPYIASTNQGKSIGLPLDWYHIQYFRHLDGNGFGAQIAIPLSGGSPAILVRNASGNEWSLWRNIGGGNMILQRSWNIQHSIMKGVSSSNSARNVEKVVGIGTWIPRGSGRIILRFAGKYTIYSSDYNRGDLKFYIYRDGKAIQFNGSCPTNSEWGIEVTETLSVPASIDVSFITQPNAEHIWTATSAPATTSPFEATFAISVRAGETLAFMAAINGCTLINPYIDVMYDGF